VAAGEADDMAIDYGEQGIERDRKDQHERRQDGTEAQRSRHAAVGSLGLMAVERSAVCNLAPAKPRGVSCRPNRKSPPSALLRRRAWRAFLLMNVSVLMLAAALTRAASAQGLGVAENDLGARRHLDVMGKPCLQSNGTTERLVSNPRILNHTVSLDNHCFDSIKVKVCYYRTDECTDVTVPPRGRKEQIIGVFPAMQSFRYEVKELF
jgi:hypothetical protein